MATSPTRAARRGHATRSRASGTARRGCTTLRHAPGPRRVRTRCPAASPSRHRAHGTRTTPPACCRARPRSGDCSAAATATAWGSARLIGSSGSSRTASSSPRTSPPASMCLAGGGIARRPHRFGKIAPTSRSLHDPASADVKSVYGLQRKGGAWMWPFRMHLVWRYLGNAPMPRASCLAACGCASRRERCSARLSRRPGVRAPAVG
mmetsp:Transcript_32913/g.86857  ORF Transcript_32913/g.86857 Transcript_32913/m.86857 type:complete len:207 (+) Transcript_32913:324-944(+)